MSFNVYGERGVVDLLAWHAQTRTLLVIELKTELVDVQELIGTLGRKVRLAARIGRERGWLPRTVVSWVVLSQSSMNHRRVMTHRAVLRAAFPQDGRAIRHWLRAPRGSVAGLSMWSNATPGGTKRSLGPSRRVARQRG